MSIIALAKSYNEFQHAFGQGNHLNYADLIQELFSPAFKKIANGNLLVSERSLLLNQLNGVKEMAGIWEIQSRELIPSQDNTKCTISYIISTENAGDFDVIAILSSSNKKHIDSIEEVYYQIVK
ncbi:MAG TPA: hypothetical protein VGU44_05925 [Gammaproteobacteria bacterium]|nr:hypothetical protein [Gammaproteobacteria bacterium]